MYRKFNKRFKPYGYKNKSEIVKHRLSVLVVGDESVAKLLMFRSKLGECNVHNVAKNGSRLECVKNDQLKDIVSYEVIIVSAGRHNLGDLDNAKAQFTEIAKLVSTY